MKDDLLPGTVHTIAPDVHDRLAGDATLPPLWNGLTPLGRNEYLCWIEDAKQRATRLRRIDRLCADLQAGKRRPCCWPGCSHRPDKPPSRWQQAVAKGRDA